MSIEKSIVFNFRKAPEPVEEGSVCQACLDGKLYFNTENCSCHIRAPCASCENALLKCNACGDEFKP
jgi:hypothetical protein